MNPICPVTRFASFFTPETSAWEEDGYELALQYNYYLYCPQEKETVVLYGIVGSISIIIGLKSHYKERTRNSLFLTDAAEEDVLESGWSLGRSSYFRENGLFQ